MKAKPMGMLGMVPAGWPNHLPGAASRTLEALPERHLMHRMNKFTLLADPAGGFRGVPARGVEQQGQPKAAPLWDA